MNLPVLAWRNVWRNRRRSLITIAAMAFALWTEMIYSGLGAGLVADLSSDATEMDMGEIQVFTPGWQDRPSLHETLDVAPILARLDAAGIPASPRLQGGGLAASGPLSVGVALVGLDPARDRKVLRIHEAVAEGAWLDPSDPKGVVVGRGLARSLSLTLGSELVVLSQGADGSMANDLFTVRGILYSVGAGTDRAAVLMVEPTFREMMTLPEGAHRILVRAPEGTSLDAAVTQVAEMAPGAKVQSWKQINPFLAQMFDAVQVQMKIIYFILYVAVGILVLNAMLMALFERIREFGVLKAIGFGPGQVFSLMVMEAMVQAAVATVVGGVCAVPVMLWLAEHGIDIGVLGGVSMVGMTMPPVWHAVYSVAALQVPVVMLFGIVFVSALYPAVKAAWIPPVDAMHHQ